MSTWWLVPTLIVGLFIVGFISQLAVMHTLGSAVNECERVHNVYQCRLVPTPVTQDGQPLDMSDPFHPEENSSEQS